jgi:tetratricopeptide (TPR) repeat protein
MIAESVEVLCARARDALAQRAPEKARELYLRALTLEDDSPDIHYGLASVCFQMKDLRSALHHFEEVTRLDPHRAGAFINLGALYNLMDRLDDAVQALRRGIQLDAHRGEGYYNLALVYRRKGQNDLAIQAYREALRVNPQMADAHYNLGNVYFDKQQFGLALNHYKQALQLRPNWDKALHGLASVQTAVAEEKARQTPPPAGDTPSTPTPTAPPTRSVDMERTVDPTTQGELLTILHQATIESEQSGKVYLGVIEKEIEPAIKELSSALLYQDTSAGELDACVQKFEAALATMRTSQAKLLASIERVRTLGDDLLK